MSFRKYAEYKASGVEWLGEVPKHWEVRRLKYICRFAYGDSLPSEMRIEGKVPVYGSNGHVGFHSFSNTTAPCIIIGRKGSFGKVNYSSDSAFAIDTTFFVDSRYTNANIRWLYYLLVLLQLDAVSKDSIVPGLNREDAYQQIGLYPPLEEQKRIAAFLDKETAKMDALIDKQEQLITLLREKRQAMISHAVTKGLNRNVKMKESGITWLGEVPAHWEVKKIKHILLTKKGSIKTGPFGSQLTTRDMEGTDIKVINQRNVIDNDFDFGDNFINHEKYIELRAFTIFPGDILITTRGTIGRTAIFPNKNGTSILHPCLMRLQVDEKYWLKELIALIIHGSGYFLEQLKILSNATTIDVIYSETLKNVTIALPPTREEQKQIIAFLDSETTKIDTLIEKCETAIELLKERRTALISAAVTGKIDVRNAV